MQSPETTPVSSGNFALSRHIETDFLYPDSARQSPLCHKLAEESHFPHTPQVRSVLVDGAVLMGVDEDGVVGELDD